MFLFLILRKLKALSLQKSYRLCAPNRFHISKPQETFLVKLISFFLISPRHENGSLVGAVQIAGCLPWQKASIDDPRYNKYLQWHNSSFPIKRTPKLFKLISARASKMFRKFLEPKIERRIKSLNELHKYLDERWLARSAEKEMAGKINFRREPLHFSIFHSFHPQNTSPTSSTRRSIHFTATSTRKINCFTRFRSKASRQLSTEWPRRIA